MPDAEWGRVCGQGEQQHPGQRVGLIHLTQPIAHLLPFKPQPIAHLLTLKPQLLALSDHTRCAGSAAATPTSGSCPGRMGALRAAASCFGTGAYIWGAPPFPDVCQERHGMNACIQLFAQSLLQCKDDIEQGTPCACTGWCRRHACAICGLMWRGLALQAATSLRVGNTETGDQDHGYSHDPGLSSTHGMQEAQHRPAPAPEAAAAVQATLPLSLLLALHPRTRRPTHPRTPHPTHPRTRRPAQAPPTHLTHPQVGAPSRRHMMKGRTLLTCSRQNTVHSQWDQSMASCLHLHC